MRARTGFKTGTAYYSGTEALGRVSSLPFHTSGSNAIDLLLQGGYREGRLTLIFGRSGSWKSQLAAQAALFAARAGVKSLYVDTEGSFRPERLDQMIKARGWEKGGLLERIVYVRSASSSEQMETIRRVSAHSMTSECRLVVVDTLTRNFSVDLPGRANLASRQAALNVHLSEMARDAFLCGRAYVLTNRVTFGTIHDVGLGGRTVEQLVHSSLRLEKETGGIRVTHMSSGESVLARAAAAGID